MGQAKRRGTFEQRKAESEERERVRQFEAAERERIRYAAACAEAENAGKPPPVRFPFPHGQRLRVAALMGAVLGLNR